MLCRVIIVCKARDGAGRPLCIIITMLWRLVKVVSCVATYKYMTLCVFHYLHHSEYIEKNHFTCTNIFLIVNKCHEKNKACSVIPPLNTLFMSLNPKATLKK